MYNEKQYLCIGTLLKKKYISMFQSMLKQLLRYSVGDLDIKYAHKDKQYQKITALKNKEILLSCKKRNAKNAHNFISNCHIDSIFAVQVKKVIPYT